MKKHFPLFILLILLLVVVIPSQSGADSPRQKKRDQALIKAILLEDIPGVRVALKAGANPDARNTQQPPVASGVPSASVTSHSAPIQPPEGHSTALQLALRFYTTDASTVVKSLLLAGANANLPDDHHRTPLMLSVRYSSPSVVRLLLPHCHRINAQDDEGWTALHYVMREYSPPILSLLLARGADVNVQDNEGWTPLMRGIWPCYADGLLPLLDRHAEVNRKTRDGRTALDIARERQAKDCETLLLKAGAKTGKETVK